MSKPKNPCKACPVVEGGHICDRVKNGKSLCADYVPYALYLANRKIRAMVRTIKAYECSRCTACTNCHLYKFTKKGGA